MAASSAATRTVREATDGRCQVGLPMLGAARTDRTPSVGQDPDGGDWILPLVRRAQERVMSQKAAVLTMGMSKTHYIENLQGVGHLSIRRLGLLGEDFWRALLDEVRAHFGMDDDAARLDRALDGMSASMKVIAEIARKGLSR